MPRRRSSRGSLRRTRPPPCSRAMAFRIPPSLSSRCPRNSLSRGRSTRTAKQNGATRSYRPSTPPGRTPPSLSRAWCRPYPSCGRDRSRRARWTIRDPRRRSSWTRRRRRRPLCSRRGHGCRPGATDRSASTRASKRRRPRRYCRLSCRPGRQLISSSQRSTSLMITSMKQRTVRYYECMKSIQ